ncbi:hypothetical protein [Prosthecobacter sp.]
MFESTTPDSAKAAAAFVPENDYPYFGYEPESVKVASALAESFSS